MAVYEALSEEECYLAAILTDRSGIDIAEFLHNDRTAKDGCFRARPYQYTWWRDDSTYQADLCSRSVGKSLSIAVRAFAHGFVNPGFEMLVVGPELVHLEPIMDLIETWIFDCRLSRETCKKSPTHRPFLLNFNNSARIMARLPQRTGKGVKGQHPLWLEADEYQDFPPDGHKELLETLQADVPGSMWRAHGVTRGVRDAFYEITSYANDTPPLRTPPKQREEDWTVHRVVAMAREDWSDKERQQKIARYGSRDDPDYRRNVLGSHGDAQNPLFVMHRLMKSVDDDPSTEYNTDEYWNFSIKDTELDRMQADITDLLVKPACHDKFKTTWAGADIGWTQDPTEILIFGEYPLKGDELSDAKARSKSVPSDGLSRLKCIARLSLRRISEPAQADVITWVIDNYHPQVFAMDSTGAGLPLFQQVQRRMSDAADTLRSRQARQAAECIKGYNFSSRILVEFDETVDIPEEFTLEEKAKETGIDRNVLEYSTDQLRSYVDDGRLWLPWDRELIGEMSGQTFSYSKATMDRYGRRRIFSQGTFHALDAMRMAILGHKQFSIEAMMAMGEPENGPVLDIFMMG